MFFVKGRSKRDADPWWLGGGQRCRVLPTRKRVSIFLSPFSLVKDGHNGPQKIYPQVLLDEPP